MRSKYIISFIKKIINYYNNFQFNFVKIFFKQLISFLQIKILIFILFKLILIMQKIFNYLNLLFFKNKL